MSPADSRHEVAKPTRLPEPETSLPGASLRWGQRYAMVHPQHFRIDYAINPYMDTADQPILERALRQWEGLRSEIERLGGTVDVLEQRADSPDMVYAMNLGLAITDESAKRVTVSHMRFAERRLEAESASRWFSGAGFAVTYVGQAGVGAHFESGDAFPYGGQLLVGFGPRTEELALKHLASDYGIGVQGLRITHPGMYHLDLAFCPLDERHALVCLAAFDEASARTLLDRVPEPIILSEEEALTFCANSIVIDRTLVMPACPQRVRAELEAAGFEIVLVDVSEFHKGGGSIRCLTNPLDITVGRELDSVPGGEVRLP